MRSLRATIFVLVLAAHASAGAQRFHLEDSLRGGTMGNVQGGSFSAEGWTIGAVDDHIWYALPRLASGYVEFTVANITLAVLPLADHEIFAMYEAGYGIGSPPNYNPEFRQNHYKVLIRIYGTPEPARAGFMKLMWGICPDGAPGWSTAGCVCPTSFFAEPFDDPGPWTGDPVRVRVEWGGGTTRLLRDGVEVVGIDWSGAGVGFGPDTLHLMIGSPRNDGGLSSMPMGARFSDLVVDGDPGPLATCATAMVDAGMPAQDAGVCGAIATADGTAASWEAGVYPDANDLNVEGDGASPSGIVYLRFAPVGGVATSATLRMHVATTPSAGGGSGQVCRVDGTFDEATLTWANRPAVSATCVGPARSVAAGEEVTWDVTSLIAGPGAPVLAIVSTDPDGAHYVSREAGGCALGPRLDVTIAPGVDAGPIEMRDAGSTARDDAGRAFDAGGMGRDMTGGCGCRAAAGSPSAIPFVLAILAIRRLRRPS